MARGDLKPHCKSCAICAPKTVLQGFDANAARLGRHGQASGRSIFDNKVELGIFFRVLARHSAVLCRRLTADPHQPNGARQVSEKQKHALKAGKMVGPAGLEPATKAL